MAELTKFDVSEFLKTHQGKDVDYAFIRKEMKLDPNKSAWDSIRRIMGELADEKFVKHLGGRAGRFKVIKQIKPVQVFGKERERRPPFPFIFPKDYDTGEVFPFADLIVVREGDLILLPGQGNFGKTGLCLNMAGDNIDKNPVLLGNEYTKDDEPTPRFLNRLDAMDWVQWADEDGKDRFELLPVYEDYAEHVVRNRINIIDWINLPGEYYMISPVMEGIKRAIGNGIGVIVLQKNEGTDYGRGGSPSRDFADVELLIDRHTDYESRITVGKVKESTGRVAGRSWAFGMEVQGTHIINIREVVKCFECHGFKYIKGKGKCPSCNAIGWFNKEE
ncbi:hypothetical protein LCGC14_2884430 [marine sediment metagenome]|uniref:Uncharacterized protein n=1 Tax=marine sediment metagenome TaxID=412755 RepID=A0A0F8XZE4_9ZZZZ